MAKSAIGEILHFNTVRYSMVGAGNFHSYLRSSDDIRNLGLVDVVLQSATNRQPNVLANFKEQCAHLEGSITEINEYFIISKIVIFVKPTESGYPQ